MSRAAPRRHRRRRAARARSRSACCSSDDPEIEVVGECSGAMPRRSSRARGRTSSSSTSRCPRSTDSSCSSRSAPTPCRRSSSSPRTTGTRCSAFEVHALDYLLKPFDDARFARRAGAREGAGREPEARRSRRAHRRRSSSERARYAQRFLVRTRDKIVVVDAADDRLDRSRRLLRLAARRRGKTHLLRETMAEIEKQLDPATVRPRPPLGDRQHRPRARDPSAVPRRLRAGPRRRHPREAEPQPPRGVRALFACARPIRPPDRPFAAHDPAARCFSNDASPRPRASVVNRRLS